MMVTDRDEILSYYQSIGLGVSVGPQPLLPYIEGEGEITYFKELDGEPVSHRFVTGGVHNFKDGQSQIGNCQLEVYPMRPGPGMFISRYLETKGDGINHIAFNTTDIERDTQFFLDRGCDLVFNVTTNGKTVENYIDTRLHGDLMISLRPPADTWEKLWRKNNESHPLVNKWKFLGLGICVNDLESASDYYLKLGYRRIEEKKVRKKWKMTSEEFYVSNVLFELIQAEKDSIYKNSLAQRGDGVAEMIFQVSDLKKEIDLLIIKGAQILKISDDKKMAYIDSCEKGNLLTRLIEKE
ncbi:hypothetical protein M9C81_06390 [SAR86 cluster bacterium]|nr:hypothetical protein M9C81_06390 [SAR86 cluster bacterium]